MNTRRRLWNAAARVLLYLAAGSTAALLLFLTGYILYRGMPHLNWGFVSTQSSYIAGTVGILPNIMHTLYIIVTAMAIALPLGVGGAIYMTEYARDSRYAAAVEFATETLTGIPSIIFGMVGMLLFAQICGLGTGVLAGGLTLVMMILPAIVRTTQESLKSVPQSYREGALALGSGKWRMIRTVVLPNAVDGIVTGCILAVGRIAGESAALLYTAGFGLRLQGFWQSLRSSSASLSVALYVYASERADLGSAFAVAAILMLLTLCLNAAADLVGRRRRI